MTNYQTERDLYFALVEIEGMKKEREEISEALKAYMEYSHPVNSKATDLFMAQDRYIESLEAKVREAKRLGAEEMAKLIAEGAKYKAQTPEDEKCAEVATVIFRHAYVEEFMKQWELLYGGIVGEPLKLWEERQK